MLANHCNILGRSPTASSLQIGNVDGPADGISTDKAIPRWNGTNGRLLQNSGVIIDDSNGVRTNFGYYVSTTVTSGIFQSNTTDVEFRANNVVFLTAVGANITLGGALMGGVQSLSGAGAVNVTQLTTEYTSTGGSQALTLANGTAGQLKTIIHGVDGGSGILTPTTKTGFSTITFTNAGEGVTLQYFTTRGWVIVGIFGAVAA